VTQAGAGIVRCRECGGDAAAAPCAELFLRLLALDHSRAQPWGGLHAVNVACYFLQHPSLLARPQLDAQWAVVMLFLDDGLDALAARTAAAVRRNSHRHGGRHVEASGGRAGLPPGVPAPDFAVTITDVAVDGTFPAEGFPQRVGRWAAATRSGWAAALSRPERAP
jgi:hypothetical protein